MQKRLLFTLFFIAGLISSQLLAQTIPDITDSLPTKMEWYGISKKPSLLFVHFDKNVYTSNEQAWFTAYLLSSKIPFDKYHTLVVNLIRDDDSAVLSNEKFVMGNAFSFGSMKLPDSLLPGNYSLHVYTNVLSDGRPQTSFVQPITIKSAIESRFTASLKIAEKIGGNGDSAALVFKASAKDILTLASNTTISYTLGNGKKQLGGSLTSNIYGEANFKVPIRQLDITNNRLRLKATFQKETKRLELLLPVNNNKAIVKFFPEGGTLSVGNTATVGWEVRDAYGEPLQISGILFRNGKAMDTLQTNSFGMGRLVVSPDEGVHYHIKLAKKGQEETEYPLPQATEKKLSISLSKAVCFDTLVFRAEDRQHGRFSVIIHNYTETFLNFPINLNKFTTKIYRVPLTDVPKGIQTLTILDSIGRPVAERLFFAHFDKRTEVLIKTNQEEYATRQKVTLSLQLKDASGNPLNGLVSVACVQNNRIDPRKMADIESYTYLNSELASLPFKKDPLGTDEDNISFIEDILLIKGWRRYTWKDMLLTRAEDTLQNISSVLFKGTVTKSEKPLKKPMTVSTLSTQGVESFQTDSTGKFELQKEQLTTSPWNKVFIYLSDKNKASYQITIKDPYQEFSKTLARGLSYSPFDAGVTEKNSENLVLKKGERAEVLQEVIVRSGKQDNFVSYQKNECGDYVCPYNILNCPNHPFGGTLPIAGHRYRIPNGPETVYAGCTPQNNQLSFLQGIYTAREFYQTDYAKLGPSEQVFSSTLYWNYSVGVGTNKPQELSFYTSDIAGKFKVIVQGVTSTGVVHGEYVFNVR